MKVRIAVITSFAAALCLAAPLGAQNTAAVNVANAKSKAASSLAGRAVVGYLATLSGAGVQPIVGVPGASRVGEEMDFGVVLHSAAVAPAGGYGVGVLAETGQVAVLNLEAESLSTVLNAPSNPDRILFGPSGGVAALYYRSGAELVVVHDPAGSPTVDDPLVVSGPGLVTGLAVADSGDVVLAAFSSEESASVYSLAADGEQFVTQAKRVADLRFLPGSNDALVTDSAAAEVVLVTNVGESSAVRVVANAESGLESPVAAASLDGNTAYVLSEGSLAALDLTTGALTPVDCHCQATGLDAVGRDSRFQLTGNQPGAIAVLDASGGGTSIVLVPARPAASLTVSNRRSPVRSRSR